MHKLTHSHETAVHLASALGMVKHDRWMLSGLLEGRLRVLASSDPPDQPARSVPLFLELSPLARRSLFERRPIAVTTIFEPCPGDDDWERDWPAILYAPVGDPEQRPDGLLIVGSREPTWYAQDDIDYVAAIGMTLAKVVRDSMNPLARLSREERAVAHLLAEGCGENEIARTLRTSEGRVRDLARAVLSKLDATSRKELPAILDQLGDDRGGGSWARIL